MEITEIIRRIWLFSANKIKSSEYFSKQPTQLSIAAHNCHTAVHYLAISPPRIRITDDTGSVSPDMFGMRLQKTGNTGNGCSAAGGAADREKINREILVQQLNMSNSSLNNQKKVLLQLSLHQSQTKSNSIEFVKNILMVHIFE